jgi:hypothetical protein
MPHRQEPMVPFVQTQSPHSRSRRAVGLARLHAMFLLVLACWIFGLQGLGQLHRSLHASLQRADSNGVAGLKVATPVSPSLVRLAGVFEDHAAGTAGCLLLDGLLCANPLQSTLPGLMSTSLQFASSPPPLLRSALLRWPYRSPVRGPPSSPSTVRLTQVKPFRT